MDTLDGRLDEYSERLGGSWLLLLGALVALAAGVVGAALGPARRAAR